MGFWLPGGFRTLVVGIGVLVTGKTTINDGFIRLSGRNARILGAATVVLGLILVLVVLLVRTGRVEGGR